MKRNGAPSIKTVASIINDEWKSMRRGAKDDYTDLEGCSGVDVRLRVYDGKWEVLIGSQDYDQDHRGNCGASFIPWKRVNHTDIARDLVDQVLDSSAMHVN